MTQPMSSPDSSTGPDNDIGLPLSPSNHPSDGPGVNYGRPPQYDGPPVPTEAANVNPSAEGANTELGGGVNPRGPDVYVPGDTPGNQRPNAPYPDTSVGNAPYPDTTVGNR